MLDVARLAVRRVGWVEGGLECRESSGVNVLLRGLSGVSCGIRYSGGCCGGRHVEIDSVKVGVVWVQSLEWGELFGMKWIAKWWRVRWVGRWCFGWSGEAKKEN